MLLTDTDRWRPKHARYAAVPARTRGDRRCADRGPHHPPGQLKGYEEVLPGSADRILKMAEEQARHRQYLEKTTIDGDRKRSWWGLWLGFAISLVDLGLGAGAVYTGHAAAGAVIMGIDVVGLAAVFVYGRREQRKERESKDAQSQVPQLPVSK